MYKRFFVIISFLFLIISLISYLVLINFQTHISYTQNNNTKDITVTWGSIFDYNNKYVELYSPQQTKLKLSFDSETKLLTIQDNAENTYTERFQGAAQRDVLEIIFDEPMDHERIWKV